MIYIDTTFLLKNKTGIGAYAETIFKALNIQNKEFLTFEFKYLQPLYKLKYIIYILWLNTIFFIKTLFYKPSTFIFPGFIMPYLIHKKHRYYPVIHDLTGYRNGEMSRHGSIIHKLALNIAKVKATKIITVSETVKHEYIERFKIDSSKIAVVYNAIADYYINALNNKNILEKYNIQPQKYLLSVATLNRRKNIPELIKAFEQISSSNSDLKLVLVGGMGNEQREKLTKHPNVIFTGYVNDDELPSLYMNALLYMYPSLYEGFGIPLIEAQYCACPVLCSEIPVFIEIGRDSVEYCKPTSEYIAKKLEKLINNAKLLEKLKELGLENVKRFDIKNVSYQLNCILNS